MLMMAAADLQSIFAMRETKIGVVEDELIIADSIRAMLTGMDYVVPEPCCDYTEAIAMLHAEAPDLVLLDINLAGAEQDGIAVARYIREHLQMPFIFLTANSDAATLARAKEVRPNAFLVKPFLGDDLYAAIEIAMHNFYSAAAPVAPPAAKDFIMIKEGGFMHKISVCDIVYLESDHVYVRVITTTKKYLVRASLQQYLELLDARMFVRIHRGYVVNTRRIEKLSGTDLHIGGKVLPVSKKYRDALLAQL